MSEGVATCSSQHSQPTHQAGMKGTWILLVKTSHKLFLEADSRLATQESPVFIRITMLITVLTRAPPWKPFRPDNSSSHPAPLRSTLVFTFPRLLRYLMPSCFPDNPYRGLSYRHACYIPRLAYRHKLDYRKTKRWWLQLFPVSNPPVPPSPPLMSTYSPQHPFIKYLQPVFVH